jgi:hypothetical protein
MESATPTVSVLMPTFKHAAFITRALDSLLRQTFHDWELLILDDGSPDDTEAVVAPYLADGRIRYHRWERNRGIGDALNYLTSLARGRYIAYLPSDDLYYPHHLERLVAALDADPDVYMAYGGVRYGYREHGATPHPDAAGPDRHVPWCAMVQVVHRRDLEASVRWTPRTERISDTIEWDFWHALHEQGARSMAIDETTSEWLDHRWQHHKLITGPDSGLSRYRAFYTIGRGEYLNWQPSVGIPLDERERFGRFRAVRDLPAPGGLRILVVGELGFNPERIAAFEEHGHKLYGLWEPNPGIWDFAGPMAWGNIEDIAYADGWEERVRAARIDIIYALLNVQALPLIAAVLDAKLDIPLVFHFKESQFLAYDHGTWPLLVRIVRESAAQVFITPENRAWFQQATGDMLDPAATFILDGDLPKRDWMTDDWAPKLSDADGEIHTVCPGRPLGLDPFDEIAAAGIHVHFYGRQFQRDWPNWTRNGVATGYMHLHPTVEPHEWVSELSQYDAAWFHVFRTFNGGDLARAHWDDLNLPARLGTYAAAGLPWIMKDNRPGLVAMQRLATDYDVGIFFRDFRDLAQQLRDRSRLRELTANMRRTRLDFAFDTHVPALVDFFRETIARYAQRR